MEIDENIIEKCKREIIINFDLENPIKEKIEINVCYLKNESNIQTQILLFKPDINNINYMLTRYKNKKEEPFNLVISETDNNIEKLLRKTQLINFRKTYFIEKEIFNLGDINVIFGTFINNNRKERYFFGIQNNYSNLYTDSIEYIYSIVKNFFPLKSEEELKKCCRLNEEILKEYGLINSENKVIKDKINNINNLYLIQYIKYIFDN